jgi:hypothetical protein
MAYLHVRGAPQGPEHDAEMPSITSRVSEAYSACLLHPWLGHWPGGSTSLSIRCHSPWALPCRMQAFFMLNTHMPSKASQTLQMTITERV